MELDRRVGRDGGGEFGFCGGEKFLFSGETWPVVVVVVTTSLSGISSGLREDVLYGRSGGR